MLAILDYDTKLAICFMAIAVIILLLVFIWSSVVTFKRKRNFWAKTITVITSLLMTTAVVAALGFIYYLFPNEIGGFLLNHYGKILIGIFVLLFIYICLTIIDELKKKRKAKQYQSVLSTSRRYEDILNLNRSFDFDNELEPYYNIQFDVDSKPQFDRFDFPRHIKEKLLLEPDFFESKNKAALDNLASYKTYLDKLNYISNYMSEEDITDMKYDTYHNIEMELCENAIACPVTMITYVFEVIYVSPQGRNSYQKEWTCSLEDIEKFDRENKYEAEMRETKEYQRKAMTESLRYDILKRDGFRCVLCGRTASDGIKLHVDHIIPVAKGGKTEPSNLRSLCNDCNAGKSDKYDPFGLN